MKFVRPGNTEGLAMLQYLYTLVCFMMHCLTSMCISKVTNWNLTTWDLTELILKSLTHIHLEAKTIVLWPCHWWTWCHWPKLNEGQYTLSPLLQKTLLHLEFLSSSFFEIKQHLVEERNNIITRTFDALDTGQLPPNDITVQKLCLFLAVM